MKRMMISIKPEWVEKILRGEKVLEIRKSMPQDLPCKVYIYETKGKILIGEHFERSKSKENLYFGGKAKYITKKDYYFGKGKIVAEFTLMHYTKFDIPFPAYWKDLPDYIKEEIPEKSCLSLNELHHYLDDKTGYAWHIEDLHIYDKPKELAEFGLKRPFQSWGYLKDE